ncbi:MAG: hypothetical protein MHPSP_002357, partial [Paramarteilia canceri]
TNNTKFIQYRGYENYPVDEKNVKCEGDGKNKINKQNVNNTIFFEGENKPRNIDNIKSNMDKEFDANKSLDKEQSKVENEEKYHKYETCGLIKE